MSRQRDLVPKVEPAYWSRRALLVLAAAVVFAAGLAYYLLQTAPRRHMDAWPVSTATIIEARVRVAQIVDGMQGSRIIRRPEIRVEYAAGGANYDRWFSLPEQSNLTRNQLEQKAKELIGRHCLVHWRADKPVEAFVTESIGLTESPNRGSAKPPAER